MRDRQHHQFPVASPFPAWVEGQEGQQFQGDSRGRRDLLPGVVQRFAKPGAHSSQKGRQGHEAGLSAEQIPVLIARDRHGEMTDEVLKDLSEVSITKVLKPVLAQDVVLCTDGNQSYRSFADTENIAHVRLIASNESRVINKVYHIQNVNAYDSHLKGWLRRFNGVATKYLPNYLGWRRCLEKQGNSIAPVTYLSCALE